ncbi:uncharacterized protein BJ212DRAFT_1576659 [Suillus subaureus]|uniref:Uncharacterized protein n=1 Tax=Suillus subaureus TaxID=48587 RepID=A0A9P7JEC1_9AGAM|nr:uncharacterized protein BJ212DRAFT_1576659 [Suillus subaureus]KAG1817583.1 hypothetical protein BJ212DRAFT_1576659 [Suillus subaureus]
MASQSRNPTHLRQYFEHLAGSTCFMYALKIRSDLDKDLLAFGDDPGLAKSASHLQLLATKNAALVPESLKEALSEYSLHHHRKGNVARSKKQTIAKALGLHATPLTAQSLAATGMVKVDICDHFDDTSFKQGTLLVDRGNEDLVDSGSSTLSVPVDGSWYVIEPDESIIFFDSNGLVSLAVLHGRCSQHPDLLTYVNNIINEAVNDCKGVRPTHGGELIQFGWNAGPCHACVFGLVNNLTNKRLLMTARQEKDSHALGIFALSWNLLVASLPAEVSASCIEAIDGAGLPSMTIKGDGSDSGYTLDLPNGPLCFSTAKRAPSEGYISQNYKFPIHTDQLYAPYAMNWVTLHSIMDPDQCQLHSDCSSGGNYVDVSLRVVVKCATDTVMSMQPKFKHGTTLT